MSQTILVSAPYMQEAIEDYRPLLEAHDLQLLVPDVDERLEEDDLFELIDGVVGAICGDDAFTRRVLEEATDLQVVSKWGTGIDSIDEEAAEDLGIVVENTPDAFTNAVADTVMAAILAFVRQLPWMDRDMKEGRWSKRVNRALHECTIGIIGVGNIGRAVARRASPFGAHLIGNDIAPISTDIQAGTGLESVSKDELLRRSDFVSLNCDLNPTSRHLIASRELEIMKGDAVLVNTARGPLVDQSALVEALEQGDIAGAALDVFEDEPLPEDHALRSMDNVLLAPHNANASPSAWEAVHENTVRNLLDGLGIEPKEETFDKVQEGRA